MTITFVLRQSVISTFCVEGTASCKIFSAVEIQCYSIVKQSLTTQSILIAINKGIQYNLDYNNV